MKKPATMALPEFNSWKHRPNNINNNIWAQNIGRRLPCPATTVGREMSSEPIVLDRQQMKLIAYGAWLCDLGPNKTHTKLQEKGVEKLPSRGSFNRWFKLFKSGNRSFGDKPRSGRPKTATNESSISAVKNCIGEDKSTSITKVSTATGLTKSTVNKILKKELKLKKTPKTKIWTPIKKEPKANESLPPESVRGTSTSLLSIVMEQ